MFGAAYIGPSLMQRLHDLNANQSLSLDANELKRLAIFTSYAYAQDYADSKRCKSSLRAANCVTRDANWDAVK